MDYKPKHGKKAIANTKKAIEHKIIMSNVALHFLLWLVLAYSFSSSRRSGIVKMQPMHKKNKAYAVSKIGICIQVLTSQKA